MQISSSSSIKKSRIKKTAEIVKIENLQNESFSQRQAAKQLGISRRTVRDRQNKRSQCKLPHEVQHFLDTEIGMDFIQRIICTVEFLVTQISHGGIRIVQKFLELTNLHYWAASSVGSIQKRLHHMEEAIINFGNRQEVILSQQMSSKNASIALDETFFSSKPCLVAIEPISNYIIQEEMCPNRTAETWDKSLSPRLSKLPINICQVSSDSAKALIDYTTNTLQAHHSPDLFHIQQDLVKATSTILSKDIKTETKLLTKAKHKLEQENIRSNEKKIWRLDKHQQLREDVFQAKDRLK